MLNINHFIYLKQDTIFLTKVLLKMLSVILLVAKLLKIKVNMSLFSPLDKYKYSTGRRI